MHAASLSSPRLIRVLTVLSDGREHTTRDIVRRARVMAVSACVSELRVNGAEITCRVEVLPDGRGRRYYYKLLKGPDNWPN